jgi:hypothetical protein
LFQFGEAGDSYPNFIREVGAIAMGATTYEWILTKNFKGGKSPRIYPWNQSQIENRKSSSPRIYPWGQSKI